MNSSGYKVNLLENQTYVVEDEKKNISLLGIYCDRLWLKIKFSVDAVNDNKICFETSSRFLLSGMTSLVYNTQTTCDPVIART